MKSETVVHLVILSRGTSLHQFVFEDLSLRRIQRPHCLDVSLTVHRCEMCATKATRCNRIVLLQTCCPLNMFRAPLCPSSGAQDYTDGCGMWYITLWFTGRWSGAGLQVMCLGSGGAGLQAMCPGSVMLLD